MHRTPTPFALMLIGACLALFATTSGCDSSEEACQAGTESCECAPGNECLSGLSCLSGVCVEATTTSGDASTTTGNDMSTSVGDTATTSSDTSTTATGDTTTSTGDTGTTTTTATDAGQDVAVDMGSPLTANCPFPAASATASINEAFTETAMDGLAVTFNENGAMVGLGTDTCEAGDPTGFMERTTTECFDAYLCGGCPVVIGSRTLEGVLDFYLAPFDIPVPEGCDRYGAFYSVRDGD